MTSNKNKNAIQEIKILVLFKKQIWPYFLSHKQNKKFHQTRKGHILLSKMSLQFSIKALSRKYFTESIFSITSVITSRSKCSCGNLFQVRAQPWDFWSRITFIFYRQIHLPIATITNEIWKTMRRHCKTKTKTITPTNWFSL